MPTREALVATAAETIARGSKSFALASRLFDRTTRERAWLLYAWCRRCDDIADGQVLGGALDGGRDGAGRIAAIRALTEAGLAGETTGDPAFDALGIVAVEAHIPRHLIDAHIAGFALDAEEWRPRSADDMLRYCWHVAGSVGAMMALVMGVSPDDEDTLTRAADLGTAFQLANIARDVEEDDRGGRCYLPEDWLVEMDISPGQHMKPHFRPRLAVLTRRLAGMAADYEESAREGAKRLPFRSRWAVLAAAGIYGQIARDVAARGEAAWDHRVVVSKAAKLRLVAKALGQAARSKKV
jgi:phytoene synthase